MKEYSVTGIRYQMGSHLSAEERNDAAEKLVKGLKEGTKVLLMAEPDNPVDSNAVAVYINYNQMVGYIAREQCTEVHEFLNMNGQGEAVVCGNDGHVTFFVDVAGGSQDIYEQICKRPRQLPESPLDKNVLMPISRKERSLEAIIYKFLSMPISKENAHELIEMANHYVPLSRISICHADDYWRRATQNKIRQLYLQAEELGLTDKERNHLYDIKEEVRKHLRDTHRVHENGLHRLFMDHLDSLRNDENSFGCLLTKYQDFYLEGTIEDADSKLIAEEYDRLYKWFDDMPWAEMRNPKKLGLIAKKLNYLGVSRRELYDVFSVLLLLERLELALSGNHEANNPLMSETAIKYWKLLQKAGFVDNKFMLLETTTRKQAMYIAEPFAAKLDLKYKWKPFEQHWGIKNLAQEKNNFLDTGISPSRSTEIDAIFKE